MIWHQLLARADLLLVWGFIATAALTTILYGSQGMGLSRLSLPLLVGTLVTGNRHRAAILGFAAYLIGGWLFAAFYFALFASVGGGSWWLGGLVGGLHALFLLSAVLPILPHMHPRMATEYDGPTSKRRLEPPGFLALNYGRSTPATTILGHALYGAVLGAGYGLGG